MEWGNNTTREASTSPTAIESRKSGPTIEGRIAAKVDGTLEKRYAYHGIRPSSTVPDGPTVTNTLTNMGPGKWGGRSKKTRKQNRKQKRKTMKKRNKKTHKR